METTVGFLQLREPFFLDADRTQRTRVGFWLESSNTPQCRWAVNFCPHAPNLVASRILLLGIKSKALRNRCCEWLGYVELGNAWLEFEEGLRENAIRKLFHNQDLLWPDQRHWLSYQLEDRDTEITLEYIFSWRLSWLLVRNIRLV